MVVATRVAIDTIEVQTTDHVNAAAFASATDFETHPSNELAVTVVNGLGNIISVAFATDISADTTLTFTGTPPPTNMLSPQTIAIT